MPKCHGLMADEAWLEFQMAPFSMGQSRNLIYLDVDFE